MFVSMAKDQTPKKKSAAKKSAAKKQPAKKAAAQKKPAAKKPAAPSTPRKRPAAKTIVSSQPPKAKAEITVEVHADTNIIPEQVKQLIEKNANVVANVIKANDIATPSLRARVLKWFTRK